MIPAVLNMVLSLLAVLALMAGIVILLRRYFYGKTTRRNAEIPIDVLGHRMLQPKRSVYILKVRDKILVVGVTEAGMQRLTELPDVAGYDQSDGEDGVKDHAPPVHGGSFREYIQHSMGSLSRKMRRLRKCQDAYNNNSGSVIWGTKFLL